jgi:hypothetical protein
MQPSALIPADYWSYQNFKAAAAADKVPDAFSTLAGMPVVQGLICCLRLAEEDWPYLESLAARATGTDRAHFCVRLVKDGFVPQNAYNGLTPIDYHFARMILLRARAEKKKVFDAKWPTAKTAAKKRPFYPEVMRKYTDLRERIIQVASMHEDRGPRDGMQIALFSLGGFLSYYAAEGSTHPHGTTCILFARGVYQAAGIDVIGPSTPTDGRVDGFFSQFENIKKAAYVAWPGKDKPTLQPGDVFHIQGENTASGTDSTHVGIVIYGGEVWQTIEGGGSDHVNREVSRPLIASSSSRGKWRFKNDNYSGENASKQIIQRPVVGYVDAGRVGQVMKLDPTPLPPGV